MTPAGPKPRLEANPVTTLKVRLQVMTAMKDTSRQHVSQKHSSPPCPWPPQRAETEQEEGMGPYLVA